MKKRRKKINKFGQVWIETVIYTLIAFVMIGLVLAFAKPKIEELQDRALLQQSTQLLKEIETTILSMTGAGNQRILEIGIRKGDLIIDGANNRIVFEMESKAAYSEPGREINDGSVVVLTEDKGGFNLVTLTSDYSDTYNVTFDEKDTSKTISKATNPYRFTLLNNGEDANGKIVINIHVE